LIPAIIILDPSLHALNAFYDCFILRIKNSSLYGTIVIGCVVRDCAYQYFSWVIWL